MYYAQKCGRIQYNGNVARNINKYCTKQRAKCYRLHYVDILETNEILQQGQILLLCSRKLRLYLEPPDICKIITLALVFCQM